MGDGSADSGPVRRLVLKAMASAGIATGTSGCLGVLDDDPERDGESDRNRPAENGENRTTHEYDGEFLETGPAVELEHLTGWLGIPTDLEVHGGEDGRLFVTTRDGHVYVVDRASRTRPGQDEATVFLDLTDRTIELDGGDSGLLGIALHPEFDRNDRFFVRYSTPPTADESTPYGYDGHVERLSEFRATDDWTADPDSERILLSIPQLGVQHNSGPVLFGPDGYLYVPTGEGHLHWESDDWGQGGPSQDKGNLLGSVLRIDVDSEGTDRPYGIPPDNPLVDEDGYRDELYAWGFRNPWGASFDGDDLYVADVGDLVFESVFRVERGGNYGWPLTEGVCPSRYVQTDYSPPACSDEQPPDAFDGEPLQGPEVGYPHEYGDQVIGRAVIGGSVYRGEAVPELQGKYVFGDWQSRVAARGEEESTGALFVAAPPDPGESVHPYYRDRDLWPIRLLDYDRNALGEVTGIEVDSEGELYVLAGGVHRVRPAGERG